MNVQGHSPLHEEQHEVERCPTCTQTVDFCERFGCSLCNVCGEPETDHVLWVGPIGGPYELPGALCPGQVAKLDIYTEQEEDMS